ncbi:MAG TPA: C45 family autoproteolytic acyltransferase/hydrolase [Candidatus Acidoferrum sp.]|nr:C45 family autoproteolytic acyltransferase/hydrolase [Candidatus Acidoferrum sp.]
MFRIRFMVWAALLGCCAARGLAAEPACLTAEQQGWLAKGRRLERAGWIYLHVEGEPRERGFQHGYLLAREIAEGLRVQRFEWEHHSTMDWSWLVTRAAAMFAPRIDPEDMAELEGIAAGAAAAGVRVTRDDLIAYNGIIELNDYWWPTELKKLKDGPAPPVREACSSFIATGSWTSDGNFVLGHNTMQDYCDVFPNVIEDILPTKGHRILWQTTPGWIHSGTDFFVTSAGIAGSETTIGGFEGFDTNGVPEFVRMRRATQDAASLDQWCEIMKRQNNGGYANSWLLGDAHTGEITRLELGLKYSAWEKKRDGYFTGSNVAEDPKILILETSRSDTDIRTSSVARRVRWHQLMRQYEGRINLALARRFEADHFDTWKGKVLPGARSLCGHFELDPMGQGHDVPFDCQGTVDAKVVDAAMAKRLSFEARWGSGCGRAFNAEKFLAAHPQFDWQAEILKDRPTEPWATFHAGE